ncbi:hypothetical protein GOV07_04700 [Candidatus Woesearchaeota archaeon]|nr:hypothetical protein [Candidatus Woesearchaeota archaeon]
MKQKRSQLDIIHDMLASVQRKGGKIKPTQLLSKSNLSYKMMQEYLVVLYERELLREEQMKGKKLYLITDKGCAFLAEYRRLSAFTDAFGL